MSGHAESPGTADRALWLAIRAWGGPEVASILEKFAEGPRASLIASRGDFANVGRDEARSRLRRDHEGSARPDLSRVHPTWLVRALRHESPAVRGLVAACGPPAIRDALRRSPGRDLSAPNPDRAGDPEAIGWALSLCTERLLGGLADRVEDPPVVVAITRLRARELARLVKVSGLIKHAFAVEGKGRAGLDEALVRMSPADRVRIGFFRRLIGAADPRLIEAARSDLEAITEDPRRGHSRIGLLTIVRLLDEAEPHRARWAMQHLPYPVVQSMRRGKGSTLPGRALAAWEAWVLEAAWARLLSEGRLGGHRRGLA